MFVSYVFGVILACFSYILYSKLVNVYPSVILKPEKKYDYIIVGAGTAGCVLAARLSEDPNVTVLLLEAGDHMGYFTKIPLTATAAQQTNDDWSFRTIKQRFSSFGLWEQTQLIPRGKGLGGSGQINFLMHGFGLPEDYERWSRLGVKGWSLEDLRPYFIKAFGTAKSEYDSTHCTTSGLCLNSKAFINLKMLDNGNQLMDVFGKASALLKDGRTTFRRPSATLKNGMRHSTFDAYLKPVLNRKNLHVLLNTQAISIRFDGKIASSVYILRHRRELDNIFTKKEIILSAGALKTPQILMRSGIGDRKLLQRLKIKLVSDNEMVGENLHDHMNMPLYVTVKKSISVTLAKVFTFQTLWNYYWNANGLLSFPPVAGIEYHNESALILFSMGTASERLLRDLSNYRPEVFHATYPFHNNTNTEGFMFLSTCPQPSSRGTITLKDASTAVPIVIDPNYLHRYEDVKCIIKGLRRAEQLVATAPFRAIGARLHWPRPERCLSLWRYTRRQQIGVIRRKRRNLPQVKPDTGHEYLTSSPPDEYLECIIREVAVTGHHVGGTSAVGKVVDDELRVKTVSSLRVVDASVFPSPISLFPNSVLVGVAEKAADLIRNSH